MLYAIQHTTKYRYSVPVTESFTEVRMQPRNDGLQRCLSFNLNIAPRSRIANYRDYLGNQVHHFDIQGQHTQLTIKAVSVVEVLTPPVLPESLAADVWQQLDATLSNDDFEMTLPSHFAQPTKLLVELAAKLNVSRARDPLTLLQTLNTAIYEEFEYAPQSTQVDSPIDEAITARRGVCQDFAHIMTAMVRNIGIPCRYVSGYLFNQTDNPTRSAPDATHAWVETFLPELGWIGFDPTNNILAGEQHIRTAIGRDYHDVPPTRGIYKGEAESELSVAVKVAPSSSPLPDVEAVTIGITAPLPSDLSQQQQQQQQ